QYDRVFVDQPAADAAATGHAQHEAADLAVPDHDALLPEQLQRRPQLLLPAGQHHQHFADDAAEEMVRERGQVARTAAAEHEDAEEEEPLAATPGGNAEAAAGRFAQAPLIGFSCRLSVGGYRLSGGPLRTAPANYQLFQGVSLLRRAGLSGTSPRK